MSYYEERNKQLEIEFETFRNKLQPGQDEEWRIKIKGKKADKVAAEMVATLYDASLDQFAKNYWNFDRIPIKAEFNLSKPPFFDPSALFSS